MRQHVRRIACRAVLTILAAVQCGCLGADVTARWWKGNTHTHTFWSDGNAAPEVVADWYRSHDYDFLVLSDHNILSVGEKWFPVSPGSRLTEAKLAQMRDAFGDAWVETRTVEDAIQMRLKTLDELRARFQEPAAFIFIQGEEITDHFGDLPVHVNGMNLAELIPPQGGTTVRETLQRNIDAVIAHGKEHHRPVLAHVNHPNFGWGLTPQDIATIEGERFFEVYNGHSGVRNHGDAEHPSTEAMWDIALHERLTVTDLGLLYGVATDDAHDYYGWGLGHTNPGRGWVMVRAADLEGGAIVEAMRRGDFYASSGVSLTTITRDTNSLVIDIDAEAGLTYTTQFIGARRGSAETGVVLQETTGAQASYRFRGDELYVRAKVTSSRLHPNPYAAGDFESAWVQPVVPGSSAP